MKEYPFKVRRHSMKGGGMQLFAGYETYTARFIEWTDNMTIGVYECSDGKVREIPASAIVGDTSKIPIQDEHNPPSWGVEWKEEDMRDRYRDRG